MADKFSIYSDRGKILAEDVSIQDIHPFINPHTRKILRTLKRTAIVDLSGLEESLRTGKVGGGMVIGCECQIPGREIDLPIVENIGVIAEEVERNIRITPDDDTRVEVMDESLLVQLPSERVDFAAEYSQIYLVTASAVAYALIKIFDLGIFDRVDMIKTGLLGRYAQTTYPSGAVSAILRFPTKSEGSGIAYKISVNDVVALTNKRTFDAAALSSSLEHAAAFECGEAVGPYVRHHLLGLGYQGLNGDNIVYELIKAHGKTGTISDIVDGIIERGIEDGILKIEKKLPSGYEIYTTDDFPKWNAYAAAGQMAATIQNAGSSLSVQGAPSVIFAYNDLLSLRTGLPGVDYGRAIGTGISYEWLTHNLYGGGEAGMFSSEHISTKGSKGFVIPCVCAAMCFDAGTGIFTPEVTSSKLFKLRKFVPEFENVLEKIAEGAGR
ncbi:MAG: coenzyme-B sulfoethylthiotransferase subunit beta [Candidatus Syntropharchaeia archaeon]